MRLCLRATRTSPRNYAESRELGSSVRAGLGAASQVERVPRRPDARRTSSRRQKAEDAAAHALALNPRNASAWVARATVETAIPDWRAAQTDLDKALSLNPDEPIGNCFYASNLLNVGRRTRPQTMRAAPRIRGRCSSRRCAKSSDVDKTASPFQAFTAKSKPVPASCLSPGGWGWWRSGRRPSGRLLHGPRCAL